MLFGHFQTRHCEYGQPVKGPTQKPLYRGLALRVPQHRNALITVSQQLEQKGIDKSIQLGEQRGFEKGKLEVARTMLQNSILLLSGVLLSVTTTKAASTAAKAIVPFHCHHTHPVA